MKKRVAIVGTNGLPGRYGGWDQLMEHLTTQLQDTVSFGVYTSSYDAVAGIEEVNGAKIEIVRLKANGYQSVVYDGWSMLHASFKYDTILILGTSGCIFLPLVKMLGKKLILNPDGAEWERGKWNMYIKSFLKYSEKLGVKHSHTVISDNAVIQRYLASEYSIESELIAYGGDHAKHMDFTSQTSSRYGITAGSYAFKVCRIEPENNIRMILEVFAKTKHKFVCVGNWKNSLFGKNLKSEFAIHSNLILLDAIYDPTELNELRSNCGLYIHGHSVGGTNPSLVEAMSLGLACVVYDVSYNRETTENDASYFSSHRELEKQIDKLFRDPQARTTLGNQMSKIAQKRYKWDSIVRSYNSLF